MSFVCIYKGPMEPGYMVATPALPREYPVAFAEYLAKRCHFLKKTAEGRPEAPSVLPAALETFKSMQYGVEPELWMHSNLESVFTYLRGAKRLCVPSEWQEVVPKSFPTGNL